MGQFGPQRFHINLFAGISVSFFFWSWNKLPAILIINWAVWDSFNGYLLKNKVFIGVMKTPKEEGVGVMRGGSSRSNWVAYYRFSTFKVKFRKALHSYQGCLESWDNFFYEV